MVTRAQIANVLRIRSSKQRNTMLGKFSRKYNPFKILISTILSARCRDEVTEVIAEALFARYPSPEALAHAKPAAVKKVIHSIGFYNAKTKNIIGAAQLLVTEFGGKVPSGWADLLKLPGVGRKVAGCVRVYAFRKQAIPVDTHVHRISNRLGWVKTKTPEQTEKQLGAIVPKKYWQIVNDTLVSHGKTICLPQTPRCSQCPVRKYCARVGVTKWK